MKDSRFGYSILTHEESRRFQIAAYTYGQFQTLFGIDRGADVQPWEWGEGPVPDGQVTPRAFLDSLSIPKLQYLSVFKDYILSWTDAIYLDALTEGLEGMSDLSKGKHTDRCRDRMFPALRSFQSNTVTFSSLLGCPCLNIPNISWILTLTGLNYVYRISTQAKNSGLRTIWPHRSLPEQTPRSSQRVEK